MSLAATLLRNPFIISILGGALVVVLVWGYSLFQRASIQSMQIARNGETTEDEDLSMYYYNNPPFLPCFALGGIVSYLVWFVLQKTTVGAVMTGGAAAAAAVAVAKSSDIAMPGAAVDVVTESPVIAAVSHVVDAVKNAVAPAPIMKGGMATF